MTLVRQADEAARGHAGVTAGSAASRLESAWDRSGACPDCGYARGRSSARVHPGEGFVFTNLASGSYALRLADSDGNTLGEPSELTLEEGATRSVVFDGSPTRTLEIELFDVDGQSLTREWSRRIVAAKSDVEIVEGVSGAGSDDAFELVAIEERRELARATLIPPSLDGHRRVRPSAFGGRHLGTGVAKAPERGQPIDRARRASDSLRPEVRAPAFASVPVQCEIGAQGFVTMGPLPSAPLQLRVSAAHSLGEALVPASRDTTRVRVYLHAH
ncbi:MAG: hypothetical protein HY248_07160 [Fimbriimonas ginsengisoli]|nr:hypothetical protein [Fimbriimonas ginsengisoli]